MNQILENITELLFETHSKQERDILIYLRDNFTDIPKLTLATIADNNYCSPTSVARTIKKIGYDNFKEFQIAIKTQLNFTLDEAESPCKEFKHVLTSSNCIYVYGKGASHLSAIHLSRQLLKSGFDCSLITEQDLLYSLHNKTIVIISNSGETSSVIDIVEDVKKINNCTILTITKSGSRLESIANESISHNNPTQTNREDQSHVFQIINNLILDIGHLHHN